MGELRERMESDLRLRRRSESTRVVYLRCVRAFAAYHRRSPAALGEPEVRAFLTHLVDERRVSASTHGVYAAALRFLYAVTLRRPDISTLIPRPRVVRSLPTILSPAEVERLIAAAWSAKYRALFRGTAACPELFLTATAHSMTRSGFAYVLRKHVRAAAAACPSLTGRKISPHTLRHTCALNTLQATGDIRKVSLWLGHANQSTTEIYLQADPTEKIEAIESFVPLRLRPGRFRPPDRLIASLMPGKTPPPPAQG